MKEKLIKIEMLTFKNESLNSINARDLHSFLEIKKDFSDWIKYQIKRGFFDENIDFMVIPQKRGVGSVIKFINEYYLTLDTAKEISMMSRTLKGKEARNYFIKVEREFFKMRELLQNQKEKNQERENLNETYFKSLVTIAMMNKLENLYGREAIKKLYSKIIPYIDYEESKISNPSIEYFINNCVVKRKGAKLATVDLYQRYLEFCIENQISSYNKIQFFRIFREIKQVPKINLLSVSRFAGVRKRYFNNLEVIF